MHIRNKFNQVGAALGLLKSQGILEDVGLIVWALMSSSSLP